MVKKRKAPPSRIRYEEGHPVVSFRVPKDIYNRLREAKSAEGNSFADIFMAGLGKVEARAKKLQEARKKGYDEGYRKGYDEAKLKYRVIYRCNVCGQAMEVENPQERAAVEEYMCEHGWGHISCHERKR